MRCGNLVGAKLFQMIIDINYNCDGGHADGMSKAILDSWDFSNPLGNIIITAIDEYEDYCKNKK